MFSSPKPFASLSSGLLARKGQARPAMRPQGFNGFGPMSGTAHDDLGWNDMGEGEPESAPLPPVLVQREALKEEVEVPAADAPPAPVETSPVEPVADVAPVPLPIATVAQIGRDAARSGKAAFTLRLDADRHLRLRLASAVAGRSSQQLMVRALDAFLTTLPEVEELARQLPGPKN